MERFIYAFLSSLLAITAIFSISFAGDKAKLYEAEIIEKLIIDATKKDKPGVYIIAPQAEKEAIEKELVLYAHKIKIVKTPDKADFLVVKHISRKITIKKPALSLDFYSFEFCPICIGVFAWKNGRPILLLYRDRLRYFKIKLPKDYDYFIEDQYSYSLF